MSPWGSRPSPSSSDGAQQQQAHESASSSQQQHHQQQHQQMEQQQPPVLMRKVRVHKLRPGGGGAADPLAMLETPEERNADMDRRIAELIPGLADLSISAPGAPPPASALRAAASVREAVTKREDARRAQLSELATIFDMSVPNPVDQPPVASSSAAGGTQQQWSQKLRPPPKRVVLSHYELEMINYQRMLLRRNVWYYRDRLNNPRGPCPLHVLKDCWVQGVIDENTLVWGQGLFDWLPAKNVKLLLPMIRTPEVRFGAWIKRTFSLKPALNRIREQRPQHRDPQHQTKQVEWMR